MSEQSKEALTKTAQQVRCLEASCKIEYPTEQKRNFRLALMKELGSSWKLKEVRNLIITGPETKAKG